MTRQGYINQQKILQNRLANKYLGPVFRSIMAQTNSYTALIPVLGLQGTYSKVNGMIAFNPTIGPIIKSLYRDAYRIATPKTVVNGHKRHIMSPVMDAITYLDDHLLEKVVLPISETTKKRFMDELKRSIANGTGIDQTVRNLKDTGMNKRRAKMIVRTESVRALNFSQLKAAADERYAVLKTWIAIEDKRTRHTHSEVDGQKILWEDEFTNGCFYPGDPNAPASETINCRCTLGYSVLKDANGKPVPKQDALGFKDYNPNEPRVPAGSPDGGEWTSGVSDQEIQSAILEYQGTHFDAINNELRYGRTGKYDKIIKALDKAAKDETKDNLYRGLTANYAAELANKYHIKDLNNLDELKEKLVGKVLHDKAFMSTTRDLQSAVYFTRDTGQGKTTVLQIEGNKTGIEVGKHLSGITTRTEREFIMKRNESLIIDKVGLSKTGRLILYTRVR